MDFASFWPVFVAVTALLLIGVAAMAIGAIFTGRCLRGSCGGPALHGPDGENLSCATCPNRRSPAQ